MLRPREDAVQRIVGRSLHPVKPMPKFIVPGSSIEFEIPDDWWQFCDMENFRPATTFYLYSQRDVGVQTVPIAEVRPPERSAGVVGLHKNRLAPILLAFMSDRCTVPAVPVRELADGDRYRYEVLDGYHRYYASIAAGYTRLPVLIRSE
jgi:hypothetical protein